MHTIRYVAGLCATAALIAIAHWFPWPRKLKQAEHCALTIAAGLVGLLIWLGFTSGWFAVAGFALVGGVVALAAYLYDAAMNWRQRARFFRVEDKLDERRPKDA